MTRLTLLFALLPSVALAQQMPVRITPGPGGGATVDFGPDNTDDEVISQTHTYKFKGGPLGRAVIEVKSPEGVKCSVSDGERVVVVDMVPFHVPAEPDSYYRFTCKLKGGTVFDRKVVARRHSIGVLKILAPTGPMAADDEPPPPTQPMPAPSQPAPAPEPVSAAMSNAQFQKLLKNMNAEAFSAGKIRVVQTSAKLNLFTTEQVGALLDACTFGKDKLEVLRIVNERIIDRENTANIYQHFTFDSEKDQAQRILGDD